MPQTKQNNGRKRVDITYYNVATDDFFGWVKSHYTAPYIFVECKNYTTDIGNAELDQLSGRFGTSKGQVGISVSRQINDRDKIDASCRDTAQQGRGFIIALDDNDLKNLVDAVKNKPVGERLNLLRERFNQLVL